MYNVTAQLNLQLNRANLNQIAGQLNALGNIRPLSNSAFDPAKIKAFTAAIHESKGAMQQFGEQAAYAAKRFSAFIITAGSIVQVTQGFRTMISEAIAFDREMVKLKQVSNEAGTAGVAAIRKEIDKLSVGLGVSSSQLAKVSVTLKQANLSLSETKTVLEALALSALSPNFDSMNQTAEGTIAIMKQFNPQAEEMKRNLGAMSAVAGEFAVEAGDLIGVVQRTGGAFKAAGGNLNELMALFTSVRQTTRESAESISTGLRTILTRIQGTDTAQALKEVGVNLRYTAAEAKALGDVNLTSQFVGVYEAVRRLSSAMNDIPTTDPKFAKLAKDLGGYRQISKTIPLIQQFSVAQQAMNVAVAGGSSLIQNAEQAQGSFGNRLDKVKESFLEFGRSLSDSNSFKAIFQLFEYGANSAVSLLNALKPLLPLLTSIAAIKIGQSFASFSQGFGNGIFRRARAHGGPVGSFIVPGTGDTDSVPMDLPNGSYVIKKSSTRKLGFSGGGVVPTILTPGELVIDPKTASSLGAHTLDRMNKFGRFAAGGRVGLALGGTPNPIGNPLSATVNFSRLTPELQQVVMALTKFSMVLNNTTNLNAAFANSVDGITRLLNQQEHVNALRADPNIQPNDPRLLAAEANLAFLERGVQRIVNSSGRFANQDDLTKLIGRRASKDSREAGAGGFRPGVGDIGMQGQINMSGTSLNASLQNMLAHKAKERTDQEYISVVSRQIRQAYRHLSQEESLVLAEKQLENVYSGVARVTIQNKRIIGDTDLLNRGYAGTQTFGQRVRGGIRSAFSMEALRNYGGIGTSIAAGYGSDFLGRYAGDAANAKSSGSYSSLRGGASGLEALAFSAPLMMAGPYGIAASLGISGLNAAGGAIAGGKEFKGAQLEKAQNALTDKLQRIDSGSERMDIASLAKDIRNLRSNAVSKASASEGLFDAIGLGRGTSDIAADINKELKMAMERSAPQVSAQLVKSLSQLIGGQEGSAKKVDAELYAMAKSLIDADQNLRDLAQGSKIAGETTAQATQRIIKESTSMFRSDAARKAQNELINAISDSASFLKTFSDNFQKASTSIEDGFSKVDIALSSFENAMSNSTNYVLQRNIKAFDNPSAFSNKDFASAIESTFGQFGEELTKDIKEQYGQLAEISNKLPQILSQAIKEKNPEASIGEMISKAIPNIKDNANFAKIIDLISSSLQNKDKTSFDDMSKLAEENLKELLDPIKKYGSEIAKLKLDNANKLVDTMGKLNSETLKLIDNMQKSDQMRVDQLQTISSVRDLIGGGTGQSLANTGIASVMAINQQARILGMVGQQGLSGNPQAIGEALADAISKREASAGIGDVNGAANASRQANVLSAALENLVDAAKKVGDEYGKQADEMSRQRNAGANLAKQLALGGPEARRQFAAGKKDFLKLQSGQLSASQIARNPELAKRLEAFSQMAGDTLINGAHVGETLNASVYEPIANQAFGSPTRGVEGRSRLAQASLQGLGASSQEVINRISAGQIRVGEQALVTSQDRLTNAINQLRIEMEVTQAKVGQKNFDEEKKKIGSGNFLRGLGLSEQSIKAIVGNQPSFNDLVGKQRNMVELQDLNNRRLAGGNKGVFGKKVNAADLAGKDGILKELIGMGLPENLANQVVGGSESKGVSIGASLSRLADSAAKNFASAFDKAGPELKEGINKVSQQIINGLDPTKINEAAQSFQSLNMSFDEMDKRQRQIAGNEAAVNARINAIQGRAEGGLIKPLRFSKGGVVPGIGNSDSVPALLTPGEVVVPKHLSKGGWIDRNKLSSDIVKYHGGGVDDVEELKKLISFSKLSGKYRDANGIYRSGGKTPPKIILNKLKSWDIEAFYSTLHHEYMHHKFRKGHFKDEFKDFFKKNPINTLPPMDPSYTKSGYFHEEHFVRAKTRDFLRNTLYKNHSDQELLAHLIGRQNSGIRNSGDQIGLIDSIRMKMANNAIRPQGVGNPSLPGKMLTQKMPLQMIKTGIPLPLVPPQNQIYGVRRDPISLPMKPPEIEGMERKTYGLKIDPDEREAIKKAMRDRGLASMRDRLGGTPSAPEASLPKSGKPFSTSVSRGLFGGADIAGSLVLAGDTDRNLMTSKIHGAIEDRLGGGLAGFIGGAVSSAALSIPAISESLTTDAVNLLSGAKATNEQILAGNGLTNRNTGAYMIKGGANTLAPILSGVGAMIAPGFAYDQDSRSIDRQRRDMIEDRNREKDRQSWLKEMANISKAGAISDAEEQRKYMSKYSDSALFGPELNKNFTAIANPDRDSILNMASGFARGGSVFSPRGTDTVPAMLTPGEFVMKKAAVDKIGVQNLHKLNNSTNYLAGGGQVQAIDQTTSNSQAAANFNGFSSQFDSSIANFNAAVENFGSKVTEFASAVSTMPKTLTIDGQVGASVNTNAAGLVAQISEAVNNMIGQQITSILNSRQSMDQRSKPS